MILNLNIRTDTPTDRALRIGIRMYLALRSAWILRYGGFPGVRMQTIPTGREPMSAESRVMLTKPCKVRKWCLSAYIVAWYHECRIPGGVSHLDSLSICVRPCEPGVFHYHQRVNILDYTQDGYIATEQQHTVYCYLLTKEFDDSIIFFMCVSQSVIG